jgi:nucleoside-diphosphate-sugar epimerase
MVSRFDSDTFGQTGRFWRAKYEGAFSNNRVLVAGGTGLIGYHLADTLLNLGADVYGLGRTAGTGTLPEGVKPVAVDLRGLEETEAAIAEVKPDIVVHLAHLVATLPDVEVVIPNVETNILGSINLLLALNKTGCRRLLFSNFPKEAIQLGMGNTPFSPHCASKTAATAFARMFHYLYDLPVVIFNPYYTYGPRGDASKLIPATILSLLRGERPKVSTGEQYIEPCFVDDCLHGIVVAALGSDSLLGKTLDFTPGIPRRVRDITEDIRRVMGSDIEAEYGAEPTRHGDQDIKSRPGTLERTTELTGWRPVWSWDESLELTIEWYRRNARKA